AGVDCQAGVQGNNITGGAGHVIEGFLDERRGFFAIRHFDAAIGDHRHTEVFGVNFVFADDAVLEFAHHGGCAQGPFVHAVFAVHDQNVTGAEALKHTHLNADQV